MNPERWQQLDEIFHAALERGPAERASFLDEACAGDEALRKKIDALLAAHEEAGSFIEHPAFAVEAQSLAKAQTKGPEQSIVSQVIGRYRIIKPLGSGGMGEVYLAQDITLGRQVALKLLPAHFTADPERLHRFEQEARAASALNHSNIVTIHEIGNEGSFHFIAQEFVEGVTLSRHTRGPHLAMEEALEVIMQVASALAAAHAKGIVHRDIKPENIMVQERSHTARQLHVKVLDFGIAKLADVPGIAMKPEGTTRLLVRTEEGRAIGTPAYMSPEQARGESVDARTDIWSLGVVLYEVLTGKQPFTGETSQDVIASILRDDLPPLPSKSPEGLKWILKKALRKDREERYQTARELFSDLRELQEQLQANQSSARSAALSRSETAQDTQTRAAATEKPVVSTGETPARATSNSVNKAGRINRLGWGAGVGLLALLIAVAGITFGLYKLIGRKPTQTSQDQTKSSIPFQRMKMRKLTNTGKASAAAISPDGKWVVHVVQDGVKQSLWMRQVLTSSNVQITPPSDVAYAALTFSPDGIYLYYIAWDKKNPYTLFRMAALGGTSTKLVTDIDSNVTFSPDRKQFAFVRGYPSQGKVSLIVVNADGTGERPIATRAISPGNFGDPAWSPDGKIIAYAAENADANGWTLQQVEIADGSVRPIGSQRWWEPDYLRWLPDGSGLMFSAKETIASPSQIWYLSYPAGETHRVTNTLNDYVGVSLASDPDVLITVQYDRVSNIWITSNNNIHQAHQITTSKLDGTQGLSWTPDGKIIYASGASGRWDLWMTDANGTSQKQLTADTGNNFLPSVSADGLYIVFVSDRTGGKHIWRIDIDGNNPKQLTNGLGEWDPQCLSSGQGVLYETNQGIWKMSIDGGQPAQITSKGGGGLAISPDGKWLATSYWEPAAVKTAIYPIEGIASQKILDIVGIHTRWMPDGRALVYLDEKNHSTIISYGIDTGLLKQLIDVAPDEIFSFAWSRDGKQLAMARGTESSDVVLITNFKEQQ